MTHKELLIFDLDDTLFDYVQTEIFAIKAACLAQDIPFDENTYKVYKRANNLAKKELPSYIMNLPQFRMLRADKFFELMSLNSKDKDRFIADYMNASQTGVLFDDVEDVLRQLNKFRKVIGTNGSTFPRYQKLINSSIRDCFDGFYSSEMLDVSKPDNRFYEAIIQKETVSKERVLVIGDNLETDIYGAINAGIECCLIDRKGKYDNVADAIVIHEFGQLANILK
ncbi:MAG: HAD family hydrolase [Clostridia bacterium]|nr:HAD family hydrolase [Clostridia bacterium]